MKKPEIDLTNCVLCEICTDYSTSVFKLNTAGYVEVVELEEYPEAEINEVLKNCRGGCPRMPFSPNSALYEKNYPRHINYMPAVIFFASLDFGKNCYSRIAS